LSNEQGIKQSKAEKELSEAHDYIQKLEKKQKHSDFERARLRKETAKLSEIFKR